MSFLSPWSLLWLGSLPVLAWLWRLSATRRRVPVSSLAPFEHLLSRPSRRRRRLVVNGLFWLQAAALLALALALAHPTLFLRPAQTILVILDTSASMAAAQDGSAAFAEATAALLERIARKAPGDELFIVTTAPLAPLLDAPSSDPVLLDRVVAHATVAHVRGELGAAARVGRALLGRDPDTTVVITDEPPPAERPAGQVEWVKVGRPLDNVAFVGMASHGSLCAPSQAYAVATVQNFADRAVAVSVNATPSRPVRRLMPGVSDEPPAARLDLQPRSRQTVSVRWSSEAVAASAHDPSRAASASLILPEASAGWMRLGLEVDGADGLALDNHAWLPPPHLARVPLVLRVRSAALRQTLASWLDACESLTWRMADDAAETSTDTAVTKEPALVIADHPDAVPDGALGALIFARSSASATDATDAQPLGPSSRSYWWAAAGHPVTTYLNPLNVVSVAMATPSPGAAPLWLAPARHLPRHPGESPSAEVTAGAPVMTALLHGHRYPMVVAEERAGARVVTLFFDPSGNPQATPVALTFYNSLRWLMEQAPAAGTTDQILQLGGFRPGPVRVERPDGTTETATAQDRLVRYAPTQAGRYRFEQGAVAMEAAVNFLDPLESDLRHPVSTWQAAVPSAPDVGEAPVSGTPRRAGRAARSAAPLLIGLALFLLLMEWWRAGRTRSPQRAPTGVPQRAAPGAAASRATAGTLRREATGSSSQHPQAHGASPPRPGARRADPPRQPSGAAAWSREPTGGIAPR
jgi:hypothetical protein